MCAMKEVTLFSDDAKSRESAQQLGQVCSFTVNCLNFGGSQNNIILLNDFVAYIILIS